MEETEMQRNTENEIEEIQEETLPGEEPKTPENREEETRKEEAQEEEKQEEEKQEEPISRKAEKKAARELPDLRRRLAEAEEKADAAEKKNAELSDKYLRLAAEYDNFRRRTAAERQGAYTDGMGDTLEKILPLVDNLDRAALYEDADKVAKGVAMISRAAADALLHESNDAAEASRCAWTVAARHSVPIHTDPSYHYNRALAEGFDGPGRLLLEHGESTEL